MLKANRDVGVDAVEYWMHELSQRNWAKECCKNVKTMLGKKHGRKLQGFFFKYSFLLHNLRFTAT